MLRRRREFCIVNSKIITTISQYTTWIFLNKSVLCALEIFVWTFGGILFTPQDMLCRIKSRLIFKMDFFHKKCNESLGQLLKLHLKYYI